MTPSPHPPVLLRDALAAPSLRRSLASMVRRRIPAAEVEDIAQTILCDALASPNAPSDPEDLRRFVAGIARHKVADFHRRARRIEPTVADVDLDETLTAKPCVEARALLHRIARSVAASNHERETMGWLLREYAGEQLRAIAAEAGLPAPTVRQRVSRLRRLLKNRWAHALALVLAVGSCGLAADRARRTQSSIVADPALDPVAAAVGAVQGEWRVLSIESDGPSRSALEGSVVRIQVQGRRLHVSTTLSSATRTLVTTSRDERGVLRLELRDGSGATEHVTASVEGNEVRITLDGDVRGVARLVRR